ncbi:MAG TPA: OmpA family protein [Stellaceae bacterium]|nr:OmpA family protein [Stellaceae bacterium]
MRRRWQTGPEPHSHTDDWLMTYADMITLLLCFFAIFLAISVQKKEAAQKPVVAQVMQLPAPARPHAVEPPPTPRVERATPPAKAEPPAAKVAEPAPAVAAAPPPDVIPPPELAELFGSPAPAPVAAAPAPAVLPPAPQPEGDRITQLEMNSAAFFDSGSATLSKPGEFILREVAGDLRSEKLRDYLITVEGHTDDTPISTARFPSNWELSTARASAVVHFLLEQGIPAARLRAAGYADTFPKVPNRDASGNPIPANQSLNRRVVITLEKIERASRP